MCKRAWSGAVLKLHAAIGGAPLTYEKTIAITDEAGEVKNIINYRQYNIASKEGGPIETAKKELSN